jgi:hypothetical protein
MRSMVMMAAAMAALGGCVVQNGAGMPMPVESTSITYETHPCFGACPVYSVTVSPDGQGSFTGTRFTAVTGERGFTLPRAAYERFANMLAPYRPESGEVRYEMGSEACGAAITDQPSVDVSWTSETGASQHLYFYYGCARANQALADALRSAPEALPIEEMIGKR